MTKNDKKKKKQDMRFLRVIGAKENNLRNIDVNIPRDAITVITGPSGSGKSSLAFGVIHNEGQRRYLEGVSSYARNFLDVRAKPEVEKIENLSPTIAIDQRSIARNPRSTVGTITEIADYLRILFARAGEVHCPGCGIKLVKKDAREILRELLRVQERTIIEMFARCRVVFARKERQRESWQKEGYRRVRFEGKIMSLEEAFDCMADQEDAIMDVLLDRYAYSPKSPDKERLFDSIVGAFRLGDRLITVFNGKEEQMYRKEYRCDACGIEVPEMGPRHFSFNNPEGACLECSGLGYRLMFDEQLLITNGALSFEEGAVGILGRFLGRPGSRGDGIRDFSRFAKKTGITPGTPLSLYTEFQRKQLFLGDESIGFSGIISFLEKKHRETASDRARADLEKYMRVEECSGCHGRRLKKESLSVLIDGKNIADWLALTVDAFSAYVPRAIERCRYKGAMQRVVEVIEKEMTARVRALRDIGVGYLSLDRSSQTLSGGEGQRIRLATQCIAKLCGVVYILDEPTMGLHPRDTRRLMRTLQNLRDEGNTILAVEHDRDVIRSAEWIVDLGPGAGEEGGKIVFSGQRKMFSESSATTALYAFGKKSILQSRKPVHFSRYLEIIGAREHNLKNIDVKIPLGGLICVTGVSGSGKSSLIHDILGKALRHHFYHTVEKPGKHAAILGKEFVDKVVSVNQNPIGRTPRSNVATYTGIFSLIREIYAKVSESQGFDPGNFSFNIKGGRCEICQGEGVRKIEMYCMPDMFVRCEECGGTRYSSEILAVVYRGATIADTLAMSVSNAKRFFSRHKTLSDRLKVLEQVGLGYIHLGQSAPNLSGGEAQRVKLATELARRSTGKTVYILDEPTVGLHFEDVRKLLSVLCELVSRGNTVIVVEHNMDVVRLADWIIDMGPEGGVEGGKVIFSGTSGEMKRCTEGWTRKYI